MAEQSPAIRVITPGMLTTVQDLGRRGVARFGVPPGGALDRASFTLGNRLVGNEAGAAGLELTLTGPTLEFTTETVIALTGSDLQPTLNGEPIPGWQPVHAPAGSTLAFGPRRPGTFGARAYLCIAGGIDLPEVMGSRSTDLTGKFGGLDGRAIRTGDILPIGKVGQSLGDRFRNRLLRPAPVPVARFIAHIVLGPQDDRFTAAGLATFLGAEGYQISAKSDRMGVRLQGPAIEHVHGADLLSEGIAHGAIQVPGDGQPIVLLTARQTVGGYTKIATVCGADLDQFGQRCPGERIHFRQISVAEAREAMLSHLESYGADAVTENPKSFTGWTPGSDSSLPSVAAAWTPDQVIRVVNAVDGSGLASFRLEIEEIGLRLEIAKSGAPALDQPQKSAPVAASHESPVTAALLGVFYRRSAQDAPLLAEEGQRVEAGQAVAVIEVMKSYHEVTAAATGILTRFLVEDGNFVEYGQAIALIDTREPADG